MQCHLCDATATSLFSREAHQGLAYTIIRCPDCGVIQTLEHHDAVSPDYIELPSEQVDAGRIWCQSAHKHPAFVQWQKIIQKWHGDSPGRLLDVGCGTGGFLRFADQLGWQAYGFDASSAQAQHARKNLPNVRSATICTDYLQQLHPEKPRFDVVTLWDVLEHIRAPRPFLDEIREVMAPGGLLFIAVPSGGALPWKKSLYKLLGKPLSCDPWEHVFHYTPAALERFLKEWGFQVEESGSVVCYPRPWSLFEMLRRIGFGLLGLFPAIAPQIYVVARKPGENENQPSDGS
ncbi:MAG: class I SAM-dependent methyltransferase [Magnetococcales bacterium]|nr:class I SAM-dependent methyltransferase [Magnetococcales bacterium]